MTKEDLNAICAACGLPRGDHSREAFDYRKLAVNDSNVTWIWPLEACPFGSQPFNEKQSFVPVIPASLSAPSAPQFMDESRPYSEQDFRRDQAILVPYEPVRELVSALDRTLHNFKLLLAQKPVRDAAETIAEAERVLARYQKV